MLLFAPLVGETSLFQQGVRRLTGAEFSPPVIVTSADFRFIVTEQLAAAGVDPGAIVIQTAAHNTGPAMLAAALHLANTDAESLILVAPSDHLVPGSADFRPAVLRGVAAARAGQIVAFGIHPTRTETGYGYLELAGPRQGDIAQPLARFVEKPDLALARAFLAGGRHLWNAGIFLFHRPDPDRGSARPCARIDGAGRGGAGSSSRARYGCRSMARPVCWTRTSRSMCPLGRCTGWKMQVVFPWF